MSATKLLALVSHNFRLAWSYKLNFFTRYLSVAVSVLLFYYLDQLLQLSSRGVIEEGSYFTFVLIGSAFLRYLELASHAFSGNLRDEMLMGTIEPLLVTATPIPISILGPSSWMLIQGTLLVIGQLLLGVIVGADFSQANWSAALVILLVSLTSLVSLGIVAAAFTIVFKRTDPMNWFVNSVAYVFSGVFFPVELLPPALRIISYLLPFTYALRALRGALMRGATLGELAPDLAVLSLFAAVLLPLSIWALRFAIGRMKESGQLVHY